MDDSYQRTQASDEALILLIQQGDESAFSEFYLRHRKTMYLAAFHLLREKDDALDATQELFLHVWQHADRIDIHANIKGYLYVILRNRVLTSISRSKYLNEYVSSYISFEQQNITNTEDTVLVRDLQAILEERISQLPAKMREVYELSWKQNLTNKEIAHRMDITEGTVKLQKYHALKILRSKLQRLISIAF